MNRRSINILPRFAGYVLLAAFLITCSKKETGPSNNPLHTLALGENISLDSRFSVPCNFMEDTPGFPGNKQMSGWYYGYGSSNKSSIGQGVTYVNLCKQEGQIYNNPLAWFYPEELEKINTSPVKTINALIKYGEENTLLLSFTENPRILETPDKNMLRFSVKAVVADGTGKFASARGEITVTGGIRLPDNHADINYSGTIKL
ncbi:MAG: hypothetical protein SFU87_07225 [Chitinophagaceae bacterium]|nr:hypothetical protein [Chitinophagaceae bacterium]